MKEQIEDITGIKRGALDVIFQEVKANSALLKACVRPHDFSICLERFTKAVLENPTPSQRFGAKWKCSKCGGIIDGMGRIYYEEGLHDAKASIQGGQTGT